MSGKTYIREIRRLERGISCAKRHLEELKYNSNPTELAGGEFGLGLNGTMLVIKSLERERAIIIEKRNAYTRSHYPLS